MSSRCQCHFEKTQADHRVVIQAYRITLRAVTRRLTRSSRTEEGENIEDEIEAKNIEQHILSQSGASARISHLFDRLFLSFPTCHIPLSLHVSLFLLSNIVTIERHQLYSTSPLDHPK